MNKNLIGKFIKLLIIPSLITGFIFQLNYCKNDYLSLGILETIIKNSNRFIIGTVSLCLVTIIIYLVLVFFGHILLKKNKDKIRKLVLSLTSFLYIFTAYFFLKPSDQTLYTLALVFPSLFYFRNFLYKIYLDFKENVPWKILFQGLLFFILLNFAPKVLLILNNNPDLKLIEIRDIIYGSLVFVTPIILFPKINKVYLILLLPFFYIPSLFSLFHNINYGNEMRESEYHAIWETNPAEASGFLKMYLDIKSISLIIGLLGLALVIIFMFSSKIQPNKTSKRKVYSIIIILIFTLFSINNFNFRHNLPITYINNYFNFKNELEKIKQSFGERKIEKSETPRSTNNYEDTETHLLIIGESLDKHHMSLYDYNRKTNPLLESMKDELFIFNDVISCHAQTNPVLEKLLSFANNEDRSALFNKRSLIEYLKDAGYRTYWISNQQLFNQYSTVASTLGTQADWFYFLNDTTNVPLNYFDELLFKPLSIVLKQNYKKKFIILHLLGSHGNYCDRYPKKFDYFKDSVGIKKVDFFADWHQLMINTYDNSILYNDSIVFETIQKVKALNQNSFVLYLSDHGEEVYDYRRFMGHSEANASIYMFDIPLLVWTSDKYKIHNSEKIKHWSEYTNRKYQTDVMIHSLIDLLNLSSSEYQPQRSLFNPDYVGKKRLMGGEDYDELIKTKKSIID